VKVLSLLLLFPGTRWTTVPETVLGGGGGEFIGFEVLS